VRFPRATRPTSRLAQPANHLVTPCIKFWHRTRSARRGRTTAQPAAARRGPARPGPTAQLGCLPAGSRRGRHTTHPRAGDRQQAASPSSRRGPRRTPRRPLPRTAARHAETTSFAIDRDVLNGYVNDTVHITKRQLSTMIIAIARDNDRVDDLDQPRPRPQRQALTVREHGAALVRCRHGRSRQAVPPRQRAPAPGCSSARS
jgi:hypothetical protein